jgi:hypothetical protein
MSRFTVCGARGEIIDLFPEESHSDCIEKGVLGRQTAIHTK